MNMNEAGGLNREKLLATIHYIQPCELQYTGSVSFQSYWVGGSKMAPLLGLLPRWAYKTHSDYDLVYRPTKQLSVD
ncbi:hypothetical protein M7I_5667 [Glarea lozoyensis 74030]|uniref:Uncharacterized protein n=1 Tax=Glarea lozoyensis (strain ATCC 74030 / MF5533) TaxID=1104152 RepID=H0ESH9_GLAL7|nr:hypothetical protein M7I_5667 [Glarea lozoyensis 74030]